MEESPRKVLFSHQFLLFFDGGCILAEETLSFFWSAQLKTVVMKTLGLETDFPSPALPPQRMLLQPPVLPRGSSLTLVLVWHLAFGITSPSLGSLLFSWCLLNQSTPALHQNPHWQRKWKPCRGNLVVLSCSPKQGRGVALRNPASVFCRHPL